MPWGAWQMDVRRAGIRVGLLLAAVLVLGVAKVAAQGDPANPYRPNAADEDWTFLKARPKSDPWDPIKYIPLGPKTGR